MKILLRPLRSAPPRHFIYGDAPIPPYFPLISAEEPSHSSAPSSTHLHTRAPSAAHLPQQILTAPYLHPDRSLPSSRLRPTFAPTAPYLGLTAPCLRPDRSLPSSQLLSTFAPNAPYLRLNCSLSSPQLPPSFALTLPTLVPTTPSPRPNVPHSAVTNRHRSPSNTGNNRTSGGTKATTSDRIPHSDHPVPNPKACVPPPAPNHTTAPSAAHLRPRMCEIGRAHV